MTKRNNRRHYWLTVAKTIKTPKHLSGRLQRHARVAKTTVSAVIREAFERGLDEVVGIDMTEALKDIIGSTSGPGDLSTNKAYLNTRLQK